jgi:hypothetical protein
MDPQRWLDEVRQELQTRRLPRRYVTRLMRELSDHVMDGWERTMSKDARVVLNPLERMGSARDVAASAEDEYRGRKFAARHPVLIFGVCPLLLLPILILAMFGGSLVILEQLIPQSFQEQYAYSPRIPALVPYVMSVVIVVNAVLVSVAFAGLAARCSLRRRWPFVSALIVAAFCVCLSGMGKAKAPDHMGQVLICLGSPLHSHSPFLNLLQFMAPIVAAAVLVRREAATPSIDEVSQQQMAA